MTVLIFLSMSLPAGLPMFIKNPLAPDTQMQVNIAAASLPVINTTFCSELL